MEQYSTQSDLQKVILQSTDLTFSFDSSKPIVNSVSLTVEEGKLITLMGPSGCGKTTLLRLLAGILSPSSGTVTLDSKKVALGYQNDNLFSWLTTQENVALPMILQGINKTEAMKNAKDALDEVGLVAAYKKYPHQLSGGMRKRTELARVLSWNADIWLLDEPFEFLDPSTRLAMVKLLEKEAIMRKATVMLVSHGFDDALLLSDKVIVLNAQGSVCGQVTISLPRPRDVTEPTIQPIRRHLMALLSPTN